MGIEDMLHIVQPVLVWGGVVVVGSLLRRGVLARYRPARPFVVWLDGHGYDVSQATHLIPLRSGWLDGGAAYRDPSGVWYLRLETYTRSPLLRLPIAPQTTWQVTSPVRVLELLTAHAERWTVSAADEATLTGFVRLAADGGQG